jgi:hypothetical protein
MMPTLPRTHCGGVQGASQGTNPRLQQKSTLCCYRVGDCQEVGLFVDLTLVIATLTATTCSITTS